MPMAQCSPVPVSPITRNRTAPSLLGSVSLTGELDVEFPFGRSGELLCAIALVSVPAFGCGLGLGLFISSLTKNQIVAGAANNQLLEDRHGEALEERGILATERSTAVARAASRSPISIARDATSSSAGRSRRA